MTAPPSEVKTTYWLEMTSRDQLRGKPAAAELDVRQVAIPCPELNWFLHQTVGVEFRWGGRDDWDQQAWTRYVDRPELETWVGYVRGTPAGYYELERQSDGSVRIECFGLRRPFIGQGLGGAFLTACIERAWDMGATRVWLTTCSHDHPAALANYLARGFVQFDQTTAPPNRQRPSALFTML